MPGKIRRVLVNMRVMDEAVQTDPARTVELLDGLLLSVSLGLLLVKADEERSAKSIRLHLSSRRIQTTQPMRYTHKSSPLVSKSLSTSAPLQRRKSRGRRLVTIALPATRSNQT